VKRADSTTRSLLIERKLGNQNGIAFQFAGVGRLSEDEGNNVDAARLFAEALAIFERLKSPDAKVARGSLERVEGKSS